MTSNDRTLVQVKLDTWDGITGRVKCLLKEQNEAQLEKLGALLQDHVAGPGARRDTDMNSKLRELKELTISSSRKIARLEKEIRAVASEVAKSP